MEETHNANGNEEASGPLSGDSDGSEKNEASDITEEAVDFDDKLKKVAAEAEEYKDKYLRAVADNENLRRRYEKEKSDLLNYGLEKFMQDILPVLDSVDKALPGDPDSDSQPVEAESLLEGVRLMSRLLKDTLSKHGLEAVADEGEQFNPEFHQAIQRIESPDVEEDMVQQVFQKGYCLRGRLIRPSMVSVAVPQNEA